MRLVFGLPGRSLRSFGDLAWTSHRGLAATGLALARTALVAAGDRGGDRRFGGRRGRSHDLSAGFRANRFGPARGFSGAAVAATRDCYPRAGRLPRTARAMEADPGCQRGPVAAAHRVP